MNLLVAFISIVAVGVSSGAVLAAEPNGPDIPSVDFKTEDDMVTWSRLIERIPGMAEPTILAEFYAKGNFFARSSGHSDSFKIASVPERIALMRETPFWGQLSDDQLTFARLNEFLWITSAGKGTSLEEYQRVQILALTHEDARHLARALVSVLTRELSRWRAVNLARLEYDMTEYEKGLSEATTALSVALIELAAAESAYDKIKNSDRYRSRSNSDANVAAKAATLRMEAEFDGTAIRIAEIRARLEVIERYKQLKTEEIRSNLADALAKLDLMEVELTIELTGLTARRDAITKIMDGAKDLRRSYVRHQEMLAKTRRLQGSLTENQRELRRAKKELARRAGESPFEILREHATLRPVKM